MRVKYYELDCALWNQASAKNKPSSTLSGPQFRQGKKVVGLRETFSLKQEKEFIGAPSRPGGFEFACLSAFPARSPRSFRDCRLHSGHLGRSPGSALFGWDSELSGCSEKEPPHGSPM